MNTPSTRPLIFPRWQDYYTALRMLTAVAVFVACIVAWLLFDGGAMFLIGAVLGPVIAYLFAMYVWIAVGIAAASMLWPHLY